jgi:hypothetical protein
VKVLYLVIPAGIILILFLSFSFLNSNEVTKSEIEPTIYPKSLEGAPYKKTQPVDFNKDSGFAQKFNILNQEGREYPDNQSQVLHSIVFSEFKDSKSAIDYFDFNPSKFEEIDNHGIPLEYDTMMVENLDAKSCKSTKRGEYAGYSLFAIYCIEQNYAFQISSSTKQNDVDEKFSINFAKEMLEKIHSQTPK